MSKLFVVILFPVFLSCKNNDNAVQFRALHESLQNANKILDDANKLLCQEMEYKLHDPQTHAKAVIWQPKALEVKKLSAGISEFIDSLTKSIQRDAGAKIDQSNKTYNEADMKAVSLIFEKQGKAAQLLQKLTDYKHNLIAVIRPEDFIDNPKLQQDFTRFNEQLKNTILTDVHNDITQQENPSATKTITVLDYFENITALGANTILCKIKNDALQAEHTMLDYFNAMIYADYGGYESFSAIVTQSSNNLKAGEQLTVYAGIGAFSRVLKPIFTINGLIVPAGDDGKSTYELKINNKPGKYSIPVKIEFTKPDGVTASYKNYVKYTVIE